MIEFYRKKHGGTTRKINSLKFGIRSIYKSIGCGSEKTEDIKMITESNMLRYLGAIEERSNEILQIYALCKNKVRYMG